MTISEILVIFPRIQEKIEKITIYKIIFLVFKYNLEKFHTVFDKENQQVTHNLTENDGIELDKLQDLFLYLEKILERILEKPLLTACLIDKYLSRLRLICNTGNNLIQKIPLFAEKDLSLSVAESSREIIALQKELADLIRTEADQLPDKVFELLRSFGYTEPAIELEEFLRDVETLESIAANDTNKDFVDLDHQDAVALQEITKEPPSYFNCPLTNKVMEEPVIVLSTGISYERRAFVEYMMSHEGKDPVHSDLPVEANKNESNPVGTIALPNQRLKLQIDKWKSLKEFGNIPLQKRENSRVKSTDVVISESNYFREKFRITRKSTADEIAKSWKHLLQNVCLIFFLSSEAWEHVITVCSDSTSSVPWKIYENYFPSSDHSFLLAEKDYSRFILCFLVEKMDMKKKDFHPFIKISNLLGKDKVLMDTPYVPAPISFSWSLPVDHPETSTPPLSIISPNNPSNSSMEDLNSSSFFIPYVELHEYLQNQYLSQLQLLGDELSCQKMKITGRFCSANFKWQSPVHTFPNSQISVQGCGDGWNTLIAQRDEMIRNERFTSPAVKTSDGKSSKPVYIPQEFTINVSCPATAVPFLFSPNDQNVLGKIFPCFLSNCLTEKMCYSENFQCKVSFFRLEDHFPIIERNILSKWNGKQFIAYAEYFFPEILEYLDSSIYNATPELISPPFIQKNPEFIRKTFIRTQANNFLHSSNEKSHYYPPISEDLIDKMMKELIPLHKICMRIYERIISEFPRPTNLWKARYEAENLEKFYRQKYPHEFKKTDPNYSANDSNSLSFIQATSRLVTAASRIPPLAEMQPSSIIFGRPYALTFSSNPSFSFQPSVAGSIPQSFQQKTSSSKKISSPRDSIKCDVVVKHLLIGESGVGKTKLLLRLAYDKFYPAPLPPTQGVEFKTVRDFQYGKRVKQEISDAAGQTNHRDIVLPYIATAMSILLVYDVTNRSSFEALRNYWIGEIRLRSKSSAVITLVGNKCDCTASERAVSYEDGLLLSRELGCPFYETSAKADIHVALAFHVATNLMLLKIYHPNQRNVEEAMKLLSGGDEEMEEEIRQSVVVIREVGKKTRKAWLCLLL